MVRVGIGEESPDAGVVCEGREGKLGAVKTGSVRVVKGSGSQLPDSLSQGCISEACRLARLACISPVLCGALGAYTFFLARSERPQKEEARGMERGGERHGASLTSCPCQEQHRQSLWWDPFVAFSPPQSPRWSPIRRCHRQKQRRWSAFPWLRSRQCRVAGGPRRLRLASGSCVADMSSSGVNSSVLVSPISSWSRPVLTPASQPWKRAGPQQSG